jgi:PAS domain S-box-containing protein
MKKDYSKSIEQLQKSAKALVDKSVISDDELSEKDFDKVVQELKKNQIELEMQNEALKEFQTDLENSRKWYRELFDYAPLSYFIFDEEGIIQNANSFALQMLDVKKAHLIGKPFSHFVATWERETFYKHLKEVFSSGKRIGRELKMVKPDGTILHCLFSTTCLPDANGNYTQCNTAVTDITHQVMFQEELERRVRHRTEEWVKTNKKMKEEIRKKKEFEATLKTELGFRKTIEEAIPSGIAVCDMEGQLIHVNKNFCQILGFSESELLESELPFPYWPEDERHDRMSDLIDYMNKKYPREKKDLVKRFRRKNGEIMWGMLSLAILYNERNETIGILAVLFDITKRIQMEKELKRSNERSKKLSARLIQAQEAERKRISRELHDSLGSGLTAVKFALERKMSENRDNFSGEEFPIEEIYTMLKTVISETQRISRNLHPSILDDLGIAAALRSYLRQFTKIHPDLEVTSEIEIDEDKIPKQIKTLIYRLVQESFNNTLKHGQAKRLSVSLKETVEALELDITDDGVGFDMQELYKREEENTGLGLISMKERTELTDGTFTLESRLGEGVHIRAVWRL